MPSELEELVGFLHDPREDVREIALENLVQFSPGGTSGNQAIFKYDNYHAVADLKIIIQEAKKGKTINEALTILVNLCDSIQFRELIAKDKHFVQYVIEELPTPTNLNAELMCILLSNLAKDDQILYIFDLEVNMKNKDVFKSAKAMDCLMDLFVKGSNREINKYAVYDYLSYFFADLSRFKQGRDYFVTLQEYDEVIPLLKLLVFTEKYDAKIRREGVASTIKNSLFDIAKHSQFLDPKIDLLLYILSPLALPNNKGLKDDEIFELPDELQLLGDDKKYETLPEIVCIHLESILLLSSTRKGRDYLRSKAVYPIIRELHKEAKDEKVLELCDRAANMLMRDEGEQLPDEEEIEEIKDILGKIEEVDAEHKVETHDLSGSTGAEDVDMDAESSSEDEDDDKMVVVC